MKKLKRKWLTYAVGGLLLLGFGFSLMGEALSWKIADEGFWNWFGLGTLALIVIMSGLSIFGQAIVVRTKIELKKEKKK